MSTAFESLSPLQFSKLFNIIGLHYREALKCKKAQAYNAGCAMLGAALEANLMMMVALKSAEVAASQRLPRKKKEVKKLLEWTLKELLEVANEMGWLPTNHSLDENSNPENWEIGTHAQAIRIIRNLILHPGRFLKDGQNYSISEDDLAASFNVLDGIFLRFQALLSTYYHKG